MASSQVRPEAVDEVVVDTAVEQHRWRHPARFVRLRPDLTAGDLAPAPPSRSAVHNDAERRSSG
jgi:hypothetical protein